MAVVLCAAGTEELTMWRQAIKSMAK